eukprot:gene3136-13149_t
MFVSRNACLSRSGGSGLSSSRVTAQASKGFGASKPAAQPEKAKKGKGKSVNVDGSNPVGKVVDDAMDALDGAVGSKSKNPFDGPRPIDPKEASRGRVDVVKVKNWGSGAPTDVGGLQLESSVQRQYDGTTGGDGPPLYESLAMELRQAEMRGELKIAGTVLPIDKWSFAQVRYLQYLADCLAVHTTLETTMAKATRGVTGVAAEGLSTGSIASAMFTMASSLGLDRSASISSDLDAILSTSSTTSTSTIGAATLDAILSTSSGTTGSDGTGATEAAAASTSEATGYENQAASGKALAPVPAPAPSQTSAAYAKYIRQLGDAYEKAKQGGGAVKSSQAGGRLLAHVYCMHMVHLAGGMRFGAAATERLNLFKRGATKFYRVYPEHVEDPLKTFKQGVDTAGQYLEGNAAEAKEAMYQELPRAMQKVSLLMAALAYAD